MKQHIIAIFIFAAYLSSCVDSRYDLSKANTDVSWGGDALTIPLMSTKKVVLEEILDEDAKELLKDMEGIYGIEYDSKIAESEINVPKIVFSIADQADETEVVFSDFDFRSYTVDISDVETAIDLSQLLPSKLPKLIAQQLPQRKPRVGVQRMQKFEPVVSSTTVQVELSQSISAVKRLNFKENSTLTFSILVEDALGRPLPARLQERIVVEDLVVSLPAILKCSATDPRFNSTTNEYRFTDGALTNGFMVNTHAIDFGTNKPIVDGILEFELGYETKGDVTISNFEGLSFEDITLLNSAIIKQRIHFSPLSIANADIVISELTFQSEGTFQWGQAPITGISDLFDKIHTLRVEGDVIHFDLVVEGDLSQFGDLMIPNLQLVLPEFLFVKGKHVVSFKNLKIDHHGRVTTPVTAKIDSLHFPQGRKIVDGTFDLQGDISYFIEIVKPANAANVDEINSLNFKFAMTSDSQSITQLKGKISKPIDYSSNVALDGLPDFLDNEQNNLLFSEMHLEFELDHNVDFPLNMKLTASPIDKSGAIISANVVNTDGEPILIKPSRSGNSTKQKIWLAATDAGMPDGYQFAKVSNIENLLRKVPESIKIDLLLSPLPNSLEIIETEKTYSIKGNSTFTIPFVFKAGFKLFHNDAIKLDETLTDDVLDLLFSNSNNELQLLVNFYNTIPLQLQGTFKALDENAQPVSGVTVIPNDSKPVTIQAGTGDSEKMTPFVISIKGDREQIKKVKQLRYDIQIEAKEGESTAGGAAISPTNSIRMDIKGRVLGNITIK